MNTIGEARMTAAEKEGPLFDPRDPVFRADPYPHYALLREEAPIHWSERAGEGAWVFARYHDCREILSDARLAVPSPSGRQPPVLTGAHAERLHPILLNDWSGHPRLRSIVTQTFTSRAVGMLGPRVEAIVDSLLDDGLERGEMDLMNDFAYPLPVLTICDVLGVPDEDRSAICGWTPDFVQILEPAEQGPHEIERCGAACRALIEYFEQLARSRRKRPREDLLTILGRVKDGGRELEDPELVVLAIQLLCAAYEKTPGAIGNGALALIRHPDQLRRLAVQPQLAAGAVEECVRFDSPVQVCTRVALHDLDLHGVSIERGETLWALVGSANRDADVFDAADRFDIDRWGSPHLSFGLGAHLCLGSHFARLEAGRALAALARRCPGVRLLRQDPPRTTSLVYRTLETLPVAL